MIIQKIKSATIISGFPGIGKSELFKNNKELRILDSDSSKFSWLEPGIRNPDFPKNYINHIKENLYKSDIILVSTHEEVRKALNQNNLFYILVYPDKKSKETYIKRYTNRGSSQRFIDNMNKNWDNYIKQMEDDPAKLKFILFENEYLSNAIEVIKE